MKLQEFLFGNQPREQRLTQDLRFTLDQRGNETFVDDILNFNEDCSIEDVNDTTTGTFTNSSSSTAIKRSNSSERKRQNFTDDQLSSDICVPSDALADLEWLSNVVVEDLFSSEDLQKLELISGTKSVSPEDSSQSNQDSQHFAEEVSHQAKTRSKRPRHARAQWRSRILDPSIKSPQRKSPPSSPFSSSATTSNPSVVRKCLHCATEKTPQWRTGPQGPKTLCNACGVRYKSGRLVPEYRPASSPTFVLTKHSNSHRKVLELRRKNELQRSQQQQFIHPNSFFEVSGGQEYLIQQEPNFPEMM